MTALLALAVGCRPAGVCSNVDLPAAPRLALSLSDFQVGALAFLGDDGVSEPILATTGDALVRSGPSGLYVVERGAADVVSAFDPEDPGCPRWQTALPPGTNAHDLLELDGTLWLPSYDSPVLLGLDAVTGALVHELDLSDQAESEDGLPELDRVFAAGGQLWVVAQRLVRDGSTWTADEGRLLRIDPAGPSLVGWHPLGANPRVRSIDERSLAVASGLLARGPNDPLAAERLVDGALRTFDLESGTLSEALVTEVELGGDLGSVVVHPEGWVLLVVAADASSSVVCLDDGARTPGPSGAEWLVDGVVDGEQVMLVARQGLRDGVLTTPGLLPVDPRSCTSSGLLPTPLPPYDLIPLR